MEPYSESPILNSNLEDIKANITMRNWDWLDVNTGIEGAGKSSLGLYKCSMIDEFFEPRKQIAYSQKQFSEIIEQLDKGQAVYVDEGVEWLFNRNWNTPESRITVADLMIMRELNLYVCVNITNIRYLDVYIREDRLRSMSQVITFPMKGKIGDREFMFRERGLFEGYSRAAILDHFDPKRDLPLIPDFIEPYPQIEELEGGVELWAKYHSNKLKFIGERRKIRRESKIWKNEETKDLNLKEKDYERYERSRFEAVAAAKAQIPESA